jgi:hypothetical protein
VSDEFDDLYADALTATAEYAERRARPIGAFSAIGRVDDYHAKDRAIATLGDLCDWIRNHGA